MLLIGEITEAAGLVVKFPSAASKYSLGVFFKYDGKTFGFKKFGSIPAHGFANRAGSTDCLKVSLGSKLADVKKSPVLLFKF